MWSEAGQGILTTADRRADRAAQIAFGKGSETREQWPWLQRHLMTGS